MSGIFKTRVAANGKLQVSLTALCRGCQPVKRPADLLKTQPAQSLAQAVAKRYNLSDGEVIQREPLETWVHWVLAVGISTRISPELTIDIAELLANLPRSKDEHASRELSLGEVDQTDAAASLACPPVAPQLALPHEAVGIAPTGTLQSSVSSWSGRWHNGYPVFRYGNNLSSEDDLHFSFVRQLRQDCPDLFIAPSLGELGALSEDLRKLVGCRGYTKGSPDLFISSRLPNMGKLAVELKAPRNGIKPEDSKRGLSNEQSACHQNLRDAGWTVLVSSNFNEIITLAKNLQRQVREYRDVLTDGVQDLGTFQLMQHAGTFVLWQHLCDGYDSAEPSAANSYGGLPVITGSALQFMRFLMRAMHALAAPQKRMRLEHA